MNKIAIKVYNGHKVDSSEIIDMMKRAYEEQLKKGKSIIADMDINYQMLTKCYHVYLFFCFYLCYYYHRQVRHKTRNKNLICFSFAKEYGQE